MTTVLRASPRQFVSTPAIERVAVRALRYLQSGFSVHLRGPAGTGKTTLALHLADLLTRPIMLIFGDDEFKTSDLIGNQSGYTRKKVVDNYIHTVMKIEDEVRQNWVDSRLTLACREGFTLVYDEFNRSRPEVNNVLLSALEEKLLVLPPSSSQMEYVRVNPNFRAIFTSNPEEYCGVHATQDALMDRLITINIPEPDELTQQEILVHKTHIDRTDALFIVRLVKAFRQQCSQEKASGLRAGLTLAKVAQEHGLAVSAENVEFRDMCADILLSRSNLSAAKATQILWKLLNELMLSQPTSHYVNIPATITDPSLDTVVTAAAAVDRADPPLDHGISDITESAADFSLAAFTTDFEESAIGDVLDPDKLPETTVTEQLVELFKDLPEPNATVEAAAIEARVPHTAEVLAYLLQSGGLSLTDIESAIGLTRLQVVDAVRTLIKQDLVIQRDRRFFAQAPEGVS